MNRRNLFLGISLVTLATLMLELTLTRLFSATMYYHFAFMAISLALFGSGASGVFVYIFRGRLENLSTAGLMSLFASLLALGAIFALFVILSNPLKLQGGMANYYRLAMIYSATAIPFFFAGCAVTLGITRFAKDISRLYLFDLTGAACGCLLLIPVLNRVGAINAVLLVAVLAAVAALVFSVAGENRLPLAWSGLVLACAAGLFSYNLVERAIDIHISKGNEESNVLFSKWNSFSRITVDGDLAELGAEIKIDADAATSIVKDANDTKAHQYERNTIEGLAYHLKDAANVLIIGPGGGNDVMTAKVFGMKNITAVEVNPIIANDVMSSEPFKTYSGGIYQQPGVRLAVDEGRSFIRGQADKYDLIQATMVDTWAATAAGAFALTENNLYTVEAFKDYVTHLNDDGVLTMTRWYFEPPDQLLRLIALTRSMMDDLGINDPPRHIMIVRDNRSGDERTPATFLFKKSAFTDDEVHTIEAAAAANHFQLLFTPAHRQDNVFTTLIEAKEPSEFYASQEDNVAPTRDNNPFFFNTIRLADLAHAHKGTDEWHKTNLGTVILFELLGITAVMVALFILGPLVIARGETFATKTSTKLSYLSYFACLGGGFIIVEVAMIQKFILFLGHPVYSLTVVLFSLLIFSGIGSYLSGRIPSDRLQGAIVKLLAIIVVLVLAYILVLPPIFYGLVQLARPIRIVIAVVVMAPLALMMGMPMPAAIRILSNRMPEIIPWAWGVNGSASVLGSVAALAIALLSGFNQALLVGAGLYVLASVFISRSSVREGAAAKLREPVAQTVTAQSD
jgi:predicted membrane-bound spermidine synthase